MIQPTSLVLVAVINNPRDMEIARILGWYRIPLRSAPKIIAVDYIAFYQTGAFGEEKWRIQFVAPVRGHELTTRGELLKMEPDHPRAREEYYKIQIGPLERLPQQILADTWRRITFLYTTGEYLLRAITVNNLIVQSDERQLLWQALRERATHKYGGLEEPGLEIPEDVLNLLLGIREEGSSYGDSEIGDRDSSS
jgi:hypothetical protein